MVSFVLRDIIMNDTARDTLDNFFTQKRIPHAIIVEGTTPENRLKAAKLLAQALVCQGEQIPCGECKHCRKALQDAHPDIIFCDKESGKTTMGVDVIRQMKSSAFISTNEADRKVYIFNEAQDMTVQSQNALLKIFEEPPEHIAIIMTCDSKATLLETILSRGTVITLGEADNNNTTDKNREKSSQTAHNLCLLLCEDNELEFMKATGIFEKDKHLLSLVLKDMSAIFASAAVKKSGGKHTVSNDTQAVDRLISRFTLSQLLSFIEIINELDFSVKRNANNNLTVTRLSSLLTQSKTKGTI